MILLPFPVSMCERLLYICVCVFVVSVCQYALTIKMKTFAMKSSVRTKNLVQNRPGNRLKWLVLAYT